MERLKVVVTGATGFVGTRLFQYLARLDADEKENLDIYLFDKHYNQNCLNYEQIREAVRGADIVLHLAAMTHVDLSIPDPLPFFHNNSDATVQVLRAVTEEKCRMVYISSSEVYGSADLAYMKTHDKMYEDHPLGPQSPYAAAKAAGDLACIAFNLTYGTDVVRIRPFNLYGPNQAVEKAIPNFIDKAINGKPLSVYGKGLASRDWNYIDDTVEGLWLAAKFGVPGGVYNLATGIDYNLVDLTGMIREVLKAKSITVHITEIADRPGHVERLIGGSYYAQSQLGWSPKHSLEEGIKLTADWLISNGKIPSPWKVELR